MRKILTILILALSVAANAETYYVRNGGSDAAAGTSDATAWGSMSKVNSTTFQPGDSILFRRGDVFRGSISQSESGTSSNWIVYGAYGTGHKPLILGSKDLSLTSDWTNHSGNVWKTAATLGTAQDDISNLIFNNESSCGFKKKSIDSLNAQGKFFYNRTDDLVYLYSVGNPGTFYTHIEAAGHHDIRQAIMYWINSSYIKVENLDVRYSSAAGIECRAGNGFTVENCDVSWIGGEWLTPGDASLTRLGNGISFVQNNDSIIVRYCRVSQCYDAGISPQAWSTSSMTNMWFHDNIITNCWYSYETWSAPTYTLSNVHFYHNSCFAAGECWSNSIHQRPDLNNASHVIIWALTGTATNVTIRNNIFSESTNYGMRLDDNVNKLTVDYNVINCDTVGYTAETTKYTTLAAWQAAVSQDAHSISDDPLFYTLGRYALKEGSPAINAGTDLGVTQDFYGHARSGVPDIGAVEWGKYIIRIK